MKLHSKIRIKVYGKSEETKKNFKKVGCCEKTEKRHKKSVRSRVEMKMRKGLCCSSVVKFDGLQ